MCDFLIGQSNSQSKSNDHGHDGLESSPAVPPVRVRRKIIGSVIVPRGRRAKAAGSVLVIVAVWPAVAAATARPSATTAVASSTPAGSSRIGPTTSGILVTVPAGSRIRPSAA